MHRNKSVSVHQFAMVPKAEIPRSSFLRQSTHKTSIDAGYLIPIYCDEVLPGDTFNMNATLFARMATPIYPLMDNMYLDTFFFYCPNRILWSNWAKFMGEKDNPDDATVYTCPMTDSPTGGYAVGSLQDYMGLPTVGQVGQGNSFRHSTFWTRAYNKIYNAWFRDQNLIDSAVEDMGDSDDDPADYVLRRRGKRHDYFTSCLPWVQKGQSVTIPLGSLAPVQTMSDDAITGAQEILRLRKAADGSVPGSGGDTPLGMNYLGNAFWDGNPSNAMNNTNPVGFYPSNLFADLSQATAATINQLRQSFQIQKLLERDARGGTRYVEQIMAHWGVQCPDYRVQRPEYLGGGTTPININPVAQTSATGLTGGSRPMGSLGAFGTALAHRQGFSASFTEHGVILGLACVRADLTYQQGLHRMWSRETRYDFYVPVFAHLGEQAVLTKEIYCDGSANDDIVFGYNERWAEYRYKPSQITGLFRSTSSGTIDGWHLAQRFTQYPELDQTFIEENPPVSRVVAVGSAANGQQFILDAFFDNKIARAMPMYSVPQLIDHF